ncbi:PEP-CTERM sorting domain-containing protein [Neiella marina]|uniref:PEP-CTERM sorting domain-containing protein n=1 Tax=Neiella holothuriorum TaxID=2870530 RepID=A0ABS7EGZ1_9GAMM|nr:PEP-CTERM sorting domain-containing protein [Neiella holothuriorum]MBW8191607.1 PEP-CTERM sorting domain-containing protein [Neiella holothuriorum]
MKFTKLMGLAAAAVFATSANAGKMVLDDFSFYSINEDTLVDGVSTVVGINNAGATTTYTLTKYESSSDAFTADATALSSVADEKGNILSYENGGSAFSKLDIDWSATDGIHPEESGTPYYDISMWEGFYLDVIFADATLLFSASITDIYGNMVSLSDSVAETINGEIVFIDFDLFSGDAAMNLSRVDSVMISFGGAYDAFTNPNGGLDVTLAEVGLIPEPAMLAVFGLGLVGLGMSRRRKA